MANHSNAWIVIERETTMAASPLVQLSNAQNFHSKVAEGDWVFIVTSDGKLIRVGRVLRLRIGLGNTTVYFDRLQRVSEPVAIGFAGLNPPENGIICRLQWNTFTEALSKLVGNTIDDIPPIKDQAYIRELLQLAVMDDLLGPAKGPYEQIIDTSVRDRYLVGKLAPWTIKDLGDGSVGGLNGTLATDDEDDDTSELDLHTGRHQPGAEFDSATGKVDAESEAHDEIDIASNQSLVPSSFGLTFCVDGNVDAIEVEARWGHYVRDYDTDIYKTTKNPATGEEKRGSKAKVWQRVPCGGKITVNLREGPVKHLEPDTKHPAVCIQGTIRSRNADGDRLVTLFLVNTKEEPKENKDSAWIFQPELIVRATNDTDDPFIFRRRLKPTINSDDQERKTLEMIYRQRVEFAVGHGVSIHAKTSDGETERALEICTDVLPQYESPVSETPGFNPQDRPALRKMANKGYLDMQKLSTMDRPCLIEALTTLTNDYAKWIAEQKDRINEEVVDFAEQAKAELSRCEIIQSRLEEGVQCLADENNEIPLNAFRFTNAVMAQQRIHSIYSLARRRGEKVDVSKFDKSEHRSWRTFQLAFILLSLPSLVDPNHVDRTKPVEAYADLLWFPTGGGKTEAYLGVAAFAMAIRRMQGQIGKYDGTRGLTVIMRYTLRLLTLQQFQRATTLVCAMEIARQKAVAMGDDSLGLEPFTIGLWVGNKVTPGKTMDSHSAIQRIRNSDRSDISRISPCQLTSCPWCGSTVSDKRDVEVDVQTLRTKIYCGDKMGQCEFSKRKSSKKSHPGLPVLVVDEEIYCRPPSMLIATVDKFAMMAWRGETRTLFGRATTECPRHGLLWPDACCTGNHPKKGVLPATKTQSISLIRPPDLVIQDEFHLISGPLGTLVGIYESAIDELCTWKLNNIIIKPKIIASTATVRKAMEQVNNVFVRRCSIFPPSGLNVDGNYFSVQRPIEQKPGRRYIGVCSPGSSRPAMLIRIYTTFLTAGQALFEKFGKNADPYMTTVGYFNSLRELGGMRRLSEDDVQTRCSRVQKGLVDRIGLAQRSVKNICELTSRISYRDIPKILDQLEVKFTESYDAKTGKYVYKWKDGDVRSIDVILATNMLSVGVDVSRLGLMVVNGQPKGTAEYIQATSRVGRTFPGLVCTVLTWARPRDLSHYESFEHYHATFYKHVEAQSVTPFSPRAMDRGLTGSMLSILRLENDKLNANSGAGAINLIDQKKVIHTISVLTNRALSVTEEASDQNLASTELKERIDHWKNEANQGGRKLAYEKKGKGKDMIVPLLQRPGIRAWNTFTVPTSMREVEPSVRLVMNTTKFINNGQEWLPPSISNDQGENEQ